MLSPARARFWIAKAEAAWPEATASAATPPSSAAIALLQHVAGRVHDAGVDVAELLEREQVGGVLGVAELVGGGLVDRHRDGAGGGIGAPAGVQHEGLGDCLLLTVMKEPLQRRSAGRSWGHCQAGGGAWRQGKGSTGPRPAYMAQNDLAGGCL